MLFTSDELEKSASEHEAIRQQRIRDLEAKTILEAIASPGMPMRDRAMAPLETISASAPVSPLDFASFTAFEEFH